VKHLAEARARVIEACDGIDANPTERSWIDPDDVRVLLGAFTREDVRRLRNIADANWWANDCHDLAARIEALLPPESK